MRSVFVNARVITPCRLIANGGVVVEDGCISEVFEDADSRHRAAGSGTVIDAQGMYLSPGFVDIHTHGAGNADFMDGTVEAVLQVCRTHMLSGTTSIVPSTLTSTDEELATNLSNIEQARSVAEGMPEILGIHLEGPYFSPEQKGAQDPRYIKNPDPKEYGRILDAFPSIVRWTVAPELPGALDMGRELRRRGIIASIGHSNAVYEEVVKARENGYTLVAHLYCGMSRLTRRNAIMYPGVAESALILDDLEVEIIADGKHLPPSLLRLIFKVKGPDRTCLVTDSIRAAGVEASESILGSLTNGQRVEIEDGVAFMPDRTSFGGSVATTNRLVRTMTTLVDVPLVDAVKMMTYTPARIMGREQTKGSIAAGKDADLLVFNDNIDVKLVMVKGSVQVNQL
jgi:N-acetylglucosamine-6-phosphate deacetylase